MLPRAFEYLSYGWTNDPMADGTSTPGSHDGTGHFSSSEWAGDTFEPENGNWLFVNIQSPGITFAITGLWRKRAL